MFRSTELVVPPFQVTKHLNQHTTKLRPTARNPPTTSSKVVCSTVLTLRSHNSSQASACKISTPQTRALLVRAFALARRRANPPKTQSSAAAAAHRRRRRVSSMVTCSQYDTVKQSPFRRVSIRTCFVTSRCSFRASRVPSVFWSLFPVRSKRMTACILCSPQPLYITQPI